MKHSLSWLTIKACRKPVLHGFGIFAAKKIQKNERVVVFGGYVMTPRQFNGLSKKLQSFPFQLDDDLFFGLSKISEAGEADYLNHSCNPTCGFAGEITIVAMRDIKKGEEITVDYAMCLSSKNIVPMDCLCGFQFCRKQVRADDWKRDDLQKRYKNYFVPFLKTKIKNKV